jgi:hypothetical protein
MGYPALTRRGDRPRAAAAPNAGDQEKWMTRVTPLDKLRVPLGGQEIELQQIDYEGGGMSLLRTRIREEPLHRLRDRCADRRRVGEGPTALGRSAGGAS